MFSFLFFLLTLGRMVNLFIRKALLILRDLPAIEQPEILFSRDVMLEKTNLGSRSGKHWISTGFGYNCGPMLSSYGCRRGGTQETGIISFHRHGLKAMGVRAAPWEQPDGLPSASLPFAVLTECASVSSVGQRQEQRKGIPSLHCQMPQPDSEAQHFDFESQGLKIQRSVLRLLTSRMNWKFWEVDAAGNWRLLG